MRIDKSLFKYIEYELFNYEITKKDIRLCRDSIINASPVAGETKDKYTISDSTGNKGINLATNTFILNAEKTIDAIDKALKQLSDKHRELFNLRYQQFIPWNELYLEMNISDRTYYRLRRELITQVAINLGKVNPDY